MRILASVAVGATLLLSATAWHLVGAADAAPVTDGAAADGSFSPPPGLAFESNLGQADPWVRYVARGNGFALRLEDTGAALRLPGGDIHLGIAGMHRADVSATERLPGASHHFTGNDPGRWQSSVPQHGQVRFHGIHDGIDLEFRGHAGQLELGFTFAAGATPGLVALDIDGPRVVAFESSGDIRMEADGATLRLHRPLAYQLVDGARRSVESHYWRLDDDTVAMAFGYYDHSLPLMVMPVLAFPVAADEARDTGPWPGPALAVETDATGAVWAVGRTLSPAGDSGQGDAFACRLTAASAGPDCAYLGGAGDDAALALATGPDGGAHVVGITHSSDFPLVAAHQQRRMGASDAFVLRLGPLFDRPAFSTYLGGNAGDVARGVAVDAAGVAWVTGDTASSQGFPATDGAFQVADPRGTDAFVAKFDRSGTLAFATYMGGSGDDGGNRITLDDDGLAFVSGHTASLDFPSRRPMGETHEDQPGMFLAKLHRDGGSLEYGIYVADAGDASGD